MKQLFTPVVVFMVFVSATYSQIIDIDYSKKGESLTETREEKENHLN
ncbi:hypothetical protein [Aquimarina spinulae]|nr:hypothetical protein [Aquimarina spinulae]